MRFLNQLQAALLFDVRTDVLEQVVRNFQRVEEARTGTRFGVPESRAGSFHRLFGGDEITVTFEYVDKPADPAVFAQPLGSTITGLLCADVRQRLARHRAHILVNISHGVLGDVFDDPKIAAMLRQVGMGREGATLSKFRRRLELLALAARIVGDHQAPSLVHWTQSNQLFPGELFDAFAAGDVPGHLHVHPYLFGGGKDADGRTLAGIRTFGVRHFIEREVLIEPNALPWAFNYDNLLAFLRVATIDNGYVIPDGDTFGPEDGSLSYRVLHRAAEEGDVPLYELLPLMAKEYGFRSPDYVPRDRVIDDRRPPMALMPPAQEDKQALVDEWREKRALAEGIGGRFEVRARGDEPLPPPPISTPPRPVIGRRGVFGRKGL